MAPDFLKIVQMGKNSIVRDLARKDEQERNYECM